MAKRVKLAKDQPWKRRIAALSVSLDGSGNSASVLSPPGDATHPIANLKNVKKGMAIRFAVGRPNECSSVFRVWANKDKFDVYASIATMGGLAKYSFHESGEYIFHLDSLTNERAKWADLPDPASKRISTWRRPDQFVPGWTHLLSIIVPVEDVYPVPNTGYKDPNKVRWISMPEDDDIVEFQILLADDSESPLVNVFTGGIDNAGLVDGFVLCNRHTVIVTMHSYKIGRKYRAWLEGFRAHLVAKAPADFKLDEHLGPRFAVPHVDEEDGRHIFYDLSPGRRRRQP